MKKIVLPDSTEHYFGECYRLTLPSLALIETFFRSYGGLKYHDGKCNVGFEVDHCKVLLFMNKQQGLASIVVSSEISELSREALDKYSSAFSLEPLSSENPDWEQMANSALVGMLLPKLEESHSYSAPVN